MPFQKISGSIEGGGIGLSDGGLIVCFSVNFQIYRKTHYSVFFGEIEPWGLIVCFSVNFFQVTPEKGVQNFRKRRLTYAKPKWTCFFFQEKTLWLGFGEAKPKLTFFRRKNHVHLRF